VIPRWGGDSPLVSCLMVTQANRWAEGMPPGARAYLDQDWFNRELVMVTADPHPDMAAFVSTFPGANVRLFDVSEELPGATLGELRQIAVEMSAGEYVATWDDDDLSGPRRLTEQVRALVAVPPADACVLYRVAMHDVAGGHVFVGPPGLWTMTMLAQRDSMPRYPALRVNEDDAVVDAFRRLLILDAPPGLYTYRVNHGTNVAARGEWTERVRTAAVEAARWGRS
jgi:hypothetical protein